MTKDQITEELAEEIRTNVKLRHRLGMEEGSTSGKVDGEPTIGIELKDGSEFFIAVSDA